MRICRVTTTTGEKDRQQLKQKGGIPVPLPIPANRSSASWRHSPRPHLPVSQSDLPDMPRDFLIKYSFQQPFIGRTVIVNDNRVMEAFKVLNK